MSGNSGKLGRERTTEAILEAAEELFARRGYTAVSVREIAAKAGVSHALVHRYLGSKEQLYQAILHRHETAIQDAAPEQTGLLDATTLMLREALGGQQQYLRIVTHSALHGLSFERTMRRFVSVERLVGLAEEAAAAEGASREPGAPDPRFVIASLVAMLLGWLATKDWVLPAAGIPAMSEEEFRAAFERIVLDVERTYFPAAGSREPE